VQNPPTAGLKMTADDGSFPLAMLLCRHSLEVCGKYFLQIQKQLQNKEPASGGSLQPQNNEPASGGSLQPQNKEPASGGSLQPQNNEPVSSGSLQPQNKEPASGGSLQPQNNEPVNGGSLQLQRHDMRELPVTKPHFCGVQRLGPLALDINSTEQNQATYVRQWTKDCTKEPKPLVFNAEMKPLENPADAYGAVNVIDALKALGLPARTAQSLSSVDKLLQLGIDPRNIFKILYDGNTGVRY
jgi:hypothetical protein